VRCSSGLAPSFADLETAFDAALALFGTEPSWREADHTAGLSGKRGDGSLAANGTARYRS
jgi:hypothetical protein